MAYADRQGLTEIAADEISPASVADYFALLKPRVMSLVVFTALTGMAMAPGGIHPILGFVALLAIAVGAGAAGALNMWYDADIDRELLQPHQHIGQRGGHSPGQREDDAGDIVFAQHILQVVQATQHRQVETLDLGRRRLVADEERGLDAGPRVA